MNRPPLKKGTPYRRWFFEPFLYNSIHPRESDLQTKFQLILINTVIIIGICIFANFSLTSTITSQQSQLSLNEPVKKVAGNVKTNIRIGNITHEQFVKF